MEKYVEMAIENFKNGYSCSESIVKVAIDLGLVYENIIDIATPFSGGMGTGCLCGAISGAQIVIGALFGRTKDNSARKKAAEFIEKFKKVNGATCCRVLTKGFDFQSPERKAHCFNMVKTSAEILTEILKASPIKV